MSQAINKIKSRISSVTGAYKVTSAMKLVSTVKLRTWKSKMLANKGYCEEISNTCSDIFAYLDDEDNIYCKTNKANKNLYIVISSSLGLCGGYNTNIFKLADANIKKEDDAIILGKKGAIRYSNNSFNRIDNFDNYSSIKDSGIIRAMANYIIDCYLKEEYKEIHIIYTTYKNPISFIGVDKIILPLSNDNDKKVGYPPILEPSKESLLETIVPFYIQTCLYSYLLESEVCEQASRSNAMDNATKNAEELLDNLKIEFNKARQSAITQEIVEIVGASESI